MGVMLVHGETCREAERVPQVVKNAVFDCSRRRYLYKDWDGFTIKTPTLQFFGRSRRNRARTCDAFALSAQEMVIKSKA